MKKLKLMLSALLLFIGYAGQSQVDVAVSLPDWGPAGYDNARYYYIPDIETYYDVRTKNFVYMNDGQWVRTTELPATYRDYDLYDGYKVVLTDDKEPFADFDAHKVKYKKNSFSGEKQKTLKIKKRKDGTLKIKEK